MEIVLCGFIEDGLGEGRGGFGAGCVDCPEDDIQLRWRDGCEEARVDGEAAVEFEGGSVAGFETLGEGCVTGVGEELLGGPECYRRGPGARTFEGDLAEVEVFRGEVSVGRVVFVEAADSRVAKEDAAAAVGLEAVLMGVDDDGVGVGNGIEGGRGFGGEIAGEGEVASVGCIDVDAKVVFSA